MQRKSINCKQFYFLFLFFACTHPKSQYCGKVCVWGTRCDSVGGNHALNWGGGESGVDIQISFKFLIAINIHKHSKSNLNTYIEYITTSQLTCRCEASHQRVGQLARSYEANTHSTCVCTIENRLFSRDY